MPRGGVAAAAAACLCLAAAAPAAAETRYASPTGTGADCTQPSPCSLKTAINPGVPPGQGNLTDIEDGDTVIVLGGDYLITNFSPRFVVDHAITVRGEPGQPRPAITSDLDGFAADPFFNVTASGALVEGLRIAIRGPQNEALRVEAGAEPSVVRDVYIEGEDLGSSAPLVSLLGASTLERAELVRFNSTVDGNTLNATGNVLVRDSFIRNTAPQTALRTVGPSTAARLRNLTVASSGTAIGGATGPQQVSIRNSLIDGSTDLLVSGAGVQYSITHSNYNPSEVNASVDATVTETPPNQDQTAAGFFPLLVNPLNGNFRQLAGSPTRNAGSPDAFTGAFDIDGEPRVMGSAIDIGGDEFFESTPGGPGTGPGTDTSPSNDFGFGKLKRNKKKGIAFLFVVAPGPGVLELAGKGLKPVRAALAAAGTARLAISPHKKGKAARKLRKRLARKGKAQVKARVTYVPAGGEANTQVRKLKLVRKLRKG